MRIDYSEPKRAYVSGPGTPRTRKEASSSGLLKGVALGVAVIAFVAGFGTGWHFSQKAAKKSFQAANAQNSLESTPPKEPAPAKPPQPAQPPAPPQPQQPDAGTQQQPPASPAAPAAPDQPLSFYKNLPSGQKSAVIGSGINLKDDKAKQPLQAPIPSNVTKPAPAEAPKPADKPADKPGAKPAEAGGFTVQVASYALRSEAETLKNTLTGKGYGAFISESHQGDKGTWYRVRVGRRMDQESARDLAKKLGKAAQVFPDKD